MEIKVYSPALERVGILDDCVLLWTRKYYEPGCFEIHTALTEQNVKLLTLERIISKSGSIEAGVVEDIKRDEKTKKLTVKGRFLSSYLDRRLIRNSYSYSGSSEAGMGNLIRQVTPIPLLNIGTIGNYPEQVTFQVELAELLETEIKIAKTSGLGFRIRPDFTAKKLFFEVFKGTDRTLSQSFNNRVVFSDDYENLNNSSYFWNNQKSKTVAIVGGEEKENEPRVFLTVGNASGLNAREVYVDASSIKSEDFESPEAYRQALAQKGYEELSKMEQFESYEFETDPTTNFRYKQDYDLGDIVTIKKPEWGISEPKRIVEIQEVYEQGGMTVVPILGSPERETVEWRINN